jgi:hypothetical protein
MRTLLRGGRAATLLGTLALVLLLLPAAIAGAEGLQITQFEAAPLTEGGTPATEAGSSPFEWSIDFGFNTVELSGGEVVPAQNVRDLSLALPPGTVAGAADFPRCSQAQMESQPPVTACPPASQVGVAKLDMLLPGGRETQVSPIYNLAPLPGQPAEFGFMVLASVVRVRLGLRPADYGATARIANLSNLAPVYGGSLSIWGEPSAAGHLGEREATNTTLPAETDLPPFLRDPDDCRAPLRSSLAVDSYQAPARLVSQSAAAPPMSGCELVPFAPTVAVRPAVGSPAVPAGLAVDLRLPQLAAGVGSSSMESLRFELPAGVTLSPAAGDGLEACSDPQLGLSSSSPAACPPASELATVTLDTPFLDVPLRGALYLGSQLSDDPESGGMVRLFLVAEGSGLTIKVPGEVEVDARDGRLTASFAGLPPLPFERLLFQFRDGPRAPLTMPPSCGAYQTRAWLTPTARPLSPVEQVAGFDLGSGCGTPAFAPALAAGLADPRAGGSSALIVDLTDSGAAENIEGFRLELPAGLTARVAGVELCQAAAAANGNCGQSSRIGQVVVAIGRGSAPLFLPHAGDPVDSGVYLAGPYEGGPYSLVIELPVRVGPFDLGTVTLRAALTVDRRSGRITVETGGLPQLLRGIPAQYRRIHLEIDRPGFIAAPTGCRPDQTAGTAISGAGTIAQLASAFRAHGCRRLGFDPSLRVRLTGANHRSGHPRLHARFRGRAGDANLRRAAITLPPTEYLDLSRSRDVCSFAEFASLSCPPASALGRARAWSPLLGRPLEGTVYLRESRSRLPGLAISLGGPVRVDVSARISTVDGRVRISLGRIPDLPVRGFVLVLSGGRRGPLVNNTDLCAARPRFGVRLEAQNGRLMEDGPALGTGCSTVDDKD